MEKTPKSHAGHIGTEDLKKLDPKIAFVVDSSGQTEDIRETSLNDRKEHTKPQLQRHKEEIAAWLKTLLKKKDS